MGAANKFEYGSRDWIEAVGVIIAGLIDGQDLEGVDYCICEDLTDPPVGRANTVGGTLSWFLRIRGEQLEVGGGSVEFADLRVIADYAVHHGLSRQIWNGDVDVIAAAARRREIATAKGELRIEGDLTAAPAVVGALVMRIHDPVAEITV
ncbi:hypothetical protein [Nocardia heshunensis]